MSVHCDDELGRFLACEQLLGFVHDSQPDDQDLLLAYIDALVRAESDCKYCYLRAFLNSMRTVLRAW